MSTARGASPMLKYQLKSAQENCSLISKSDNNMHYLIKEQESHIPQRSSNNG